MKSPLGKVVVLVNTEKKWQQLMAACQKHECDYMWVVGQKPTEYINWDAYKKSSCIKFGRYGRGANIINYGSEKELKKDRPISKFLSFETAMKKLCLVPKKKLARKKPQVKKWKAGNKVKIINEGCIYDTYRDMAENLNATNWESGRYFPKNYKEIIFTIVGVWKKSYETILLVSANNKEYLIGSDGVTTTPKKKPQLLGQKTVVKGYKLKNGSWVKKKIAVKKTKKAVVKKYKVGDIYPDWKKLKPLPDCTWKELRLSHGVDEETLFVRVRKDTENYWKKGQITKLLSGVDTKSPDFKVSEDSDDFLCSNIYFLALLLPSAKPTPIKPKKSQPKVIQEKKYEWDGMSYSENCIEVPYVPFGEPAGEHIFNIALSPAKLEEHIKLCHTALRRHGKLKF